MKSSVSLATLVGLMFLAGCASVPQREAQWIDPGIGTQSRFLRGVKILIACDAYDPALRQICQDRLYRDVLAKGANPVVAPAGAVLLNDRELDGQLVPVAAALGAKAIFILSLTPATTSAGSAHHWASAPSASAAEAEAASDWEYRSVAAAPRQGSPPTAG